MQTIGEYAFKNCSGFTGTLTIPEGVTSIGYETFRGCSGLTSVTIGDSVTSIGNYAFDGCSGLTSVTIPNSVTSIGSSAFRDCSGLTSVTIPNSVTSIEYETFRGCNGLTSVTIGDSVTSIRNYAFYGCSGLTSVTIPNSVTSIGEDAFDGCSGLTSVTIPNSVTSIGSSAFRDCSGLTSVTIPNSVTSIEYETFRGCNGLTSVTIGDSVTSIRNYAFYGCSGLTSVTIPNSVTSIGNYAFNGCTSIKEVKIEDGETTLKLGYNHYYYNGGKGLFDDCPLEKVYLGRDLSYDSGSSYGYSPFANQKNLTEVTIGNSVTSIGSYAFSGCSGLTSVIIPNSVTSIGKYAFEDCSGLTSVTIPNSVTSIDYGAFSGCSGLKSVTIPNSVTSIGGSAFSGCSGLKSVTIPNSVTSIGGSAFYGCSGLTSVTIPNSVTEIGGSAFEGCSGLTSVTIPNSVTSIGNYAFNGCTSIKEVKIEDGETTLKLVYNTNHGTGLFSSCPLEKVYLGRNLSYETGASYGYSPFANQKNLTEVTMGNSVTSIGNYAFYGCSGLKSVTIPNSVNSIGSYAFAGCTSIKEVRIEDGDTTISLGYNTYSSSKQGEGLFADCPLEKVYLGRNLSYNTGSSYGYSPFANQKYLTEVTISNSVTSIGNDAFYGCTSIKEVRIEDGETTLKLGYNPSSSKPSGLFGSCPLEKIYLGRSLSYETGSSYGYSPFANQKNLTEVTIGNSVTEIGDDAFEGCSGLKEIYYTPGDNIVVCSQNTFGNLYSKATVYSKSPDKTLNLVYDENWNKFDKIFYLKEDKIFVPTKWNKVIEAENIEYSDDKGCLSELGTEIILKAKNAENNAIQITWYGTTITEEITSETGFSIIPNETWKFNILEYYLSDLSRTITLSRAGELFNELGLQDIQKIEYLKIIGNINGTDVMTINRISNLKHLDLSEANIVEGGQTYRDNLKTSDDVVGSYFFYDCNNLVTLILPNSAKRIDSYALFERSKIIYISIPNSVTSIGNGAFEGCSSLISITIPNSVTSIGDYAFNGCTSIKEVRIEDGETTLELGYNSSYDGLFDSCPLEKVYLGRNLSYYSYSYGDSPFANQENLTEVTIGNSVTSIGFSAFYGCSGLTSVTIPNSVTSISSYAFYGCSGLKSVTIPNSVTSIGGSAFQGCSGLTSVTIPNSVTSIGGSAFQGCSGLTSVTIPNSVTSIGSSAFWDCSGLTSFTIPNSVTSIGNGAFEGCTSIKEVRIEDGGTTLKLGYNSSSKSGLFGSCPLEKVYLGRNLSYYISSSYGYSPFTNQKNLTEVTIGNSVTSIGEYAFQGCSGLKSVTIPNSVTSIGDHAFNGCTSIKEVRIEDGVTTLELRYISSSEWDIFGSCPLNKVYLGRNLSYVTGSSYGHSPFANQKYLTEVIIGNSVTSIGNYAFYGCSGLTSVTIPNSVTSIGNYSFYGCSGLTSVTIPDSVTSIRNYTFYGCRRLTSVTIPDSVTSIGSSAFQGCSGLTSVTIPNSVTSIGDSAFDSCYGLTRVDITSLKAWCRINFKTASSNPLYYSNHLYLNGVEIKELEIPNSVTSIGDYVFEGCSGLTSVTIPNSVTSIGDDAFSYCRGLTSLTIPNSVTSIGDGALYSCTSIKEVRIEDGETTLKLGYNSIYVSGLFGSCPLEKVYLGRNLSCESGSSYGYSPFANQKNLTEVTIGNSVTSIGNYAFYGCSGLDNLMLGIKLKSIGASGFEGCSNLSKIYSLNPTPPEIDSSVFDGVDKESCQLVVTKGNLVYYWLDPVWKDFLNMSDDLLYLSPLPAVRYGNAPINLADYAPLGYTFNYETSNSDVARLDGSMLTIVGAGEATIGASYDESGKPMEILGQMRQFIVDKTDLTIGVEDVAIEVGEEIPTFILTAKGLVYDETLEDVGELPVAFTDATAGSAPGEYPIYLEGGESRNYNLDLISGTLTILDSDTNEIIDVIDDLFPGEQDTTIRVFNLDGIKMYEGPEDEMRLSDFEKGLYIIVKGETSKKVLIK